MSIYRYIWSDKRQGVRLWQYLRRKAKPYRKRLTAETRGRINNRVSIHERPFVVEERMRIGDWEADTIIGQHHKQAIVTIVERRTGLLKMKRMVKTITSDNGKEFANHKKSKQRLLSY